MRSGVDPFFKKNNHLISSSYPPFSSSTSSFHLSLYVFFRNPHVKDRVCGLWASVADLGPSADLPSGSDPARLHPGADHPRLDDQPAEGMRKYNHTVCVWEMPIPPVYICLNKCVPQQHQWYRYTQTQTHTGAHIRSDISVFSEVELHLTLAPDCHPVLTSSPCLLPYSLVCCWDRAAFQHFWTEWVENRLQNYDLITCFNLKKKKALNLPFYHNSICRSALIICPCHSVSSRL